MGTPKQDEDEVLRCKTKLLKWEMLMQVITQNVNVERSNIRLNGLNNWEDLMQVARLPRDWPKKKKSWEGVNKSKTQEEMEGPNKERRRKAL